MNKVTFEESFFKKYSIIKGFLSSDLKFQFFRVTVLTSLAEALTDLESNSVNCKEHQDTIIEYMDKVIELAESEKNHEEVSKGFRELEKTHLDPVKFFLLRRNGYVTNTYVPNVIPGLIIDSIILIFFYGSFPPIMTLLMVTIKFFVIQIKKRKRKLLDYK